MSSETQREQALAILAKTGIWPSNYAPPALHLLWRLGYKVPPPHFAKFGPTALTLGASFGAIWGIFMWLAVWSNEGMKPLAAIITAVVSGALFGLAMASYYAYGRRKYKLPEWESLGEDATRI